MTTKQSLAARIRALAEEVHNKPWERIDNRAMGERLTAIAEELERKAEAFATMVHAFPSGDSRRDDVRALAAALADPKEGAMFDEKKLREEIVSKWGEYGAHAELYDMILGDMAKLQSAIEELDRRIAELEKEARGVVENACRCLCPPSTAAPTPPGISCPRCGGIG